MKKIMKWFDADKDKKPCELLEILRDEISTRLKIIEKIIDGVDDFESVIVRNMFSKKERQNMVSIYSHLQSLYWESLLFRHDAKKCEKWLKNVWDDWLKCDRDVEKIIRKISEEWKHIKIGHGKASYLY